MGVGTGWVVGLAMLAGMAVASEPTRVRTNGWIEASTEHFTFFSSAGRRRTELMEGKQAGPSKQESGQVPDHKACQEQRAAEKGDEDRDRYTAQRQEVDPTEHQGEGPPAPSIEAKEGSQQRTQVACRVTLSAWTTRRW